MEAHAQPKRSRDYNSNLPAAAEPRASQAALVQAAAAAGSFAYGVRAVLA
jgi:hypothetical protein